MDHLLPPAQAYQIKYSGIYTMLYKESQIKQIDDQGKITRRIFNQVKLDEKEELKIQEIESLLKSNNIEIPENWTKIDTLRYIHSGQFNNESILANIVNHLKWRNNQELQQLSEKAEELLKQGVVYTLGRDKQYRPIIFIQVCLISTDLKKLPSTLNALCVLLNTVQKHMLIPYYVEKWRIIVDLTNVSLFRLPVQIIKSIIDCTQSNYTQTLEQIHLFNPPLVLLAAWKLVERLMHPETASKIQFCDDPLQLQKYIDPDQLQQKYGGTFSNQTQYWPIVNTYKQLEISQYASFDESQYFTINSLRDIEISRPKQSNDNCCDLCKIF